ncbi:IS110-like element ISMno29 family transposase [Methylobacterium nodulans]|uniref:Transposase IS111A/IS1328/IS1533 n=1 Tax=Methylobacterium nodulans (strain LMG 21967 / CNCM I-2342 / ORS 2060) TaxID=460265 RepID=B8IF08_METNO|nr:IS110-like element ISMno29 family transposase [Methylobacterium nodulans]ACL55719.1 transposase IS111A/IS1328/IS1533 [Methylobacterium nodulans ORS 2060]ACL56653.1 transposase IS111A/IS1328/IS1533 [Methylobacterium nodulans ORS 2060]ACL56823.1 transposase IS111A/IS1328/IS1533 [Methylobacterium nodulans ORS 2060]ACL57725.1 transposase IS111A/IS1328/IS1533 [Methylobacterium nodulans ORS 2060]ACL58524.1 transposase IS111A/IS1328/IS1533 [Methylobacterium nodulans ORS 2060]
MQGKEVSKQETAGKSSVGIDVSKSWLDVHVLPSGQAQRFANTEVGIRQLKRWLGRFALGLVVVEATGKWHRQTRRSLHASGLPVAVVDPFRVRMFAKAQGIWAKTDRLDARVLAQFAAVMAPPQRPPASDALEALQELVAARDSAVAEQTALKNQLAAAASPFLIRQLQDRLARIAADIEALAGEIRRLIAADPGLARRHAILVSIPSIGDTIAATLVASLAELGTCSSRQIGLLAGLAPVADDSGARQGVRVIWGGRPPVRRVLYLAALSAARHNAGLKAFHERLIANGKKPKCAIIAVARKLAVLANSLIAQDRLWTPNQPQQA